MNEDSAKFKSFMNICYSLYKSFVFLEKLWNLFQIDWTSNPRTLVQLLLEINEACVIKQVIAEEYYWITKYTD